MTFVLLHGGFLGGWCWSRVASELRSAGHEVYAPTLTGLGERRHLLSAKVDLNTHIDDVANLIEFEDLKHVILVGHSYAGMITTGIVDRMPDRVTQLVHIDALVPSNGKCYLDLIDHEIAMLFDERAEFDGDCPILPCFFSTAAFGVPPGEAGEVDRRLTPHPLRTLQQPIQLSEKMNVVPITYVGCTSPFTGVAYKEQLRLRAKKIGRLKSCRQATCP